MQQTSSSENVVGRLGLHRRLCRWCNSFFMQVLQTRPPAEQQNFEPSYCSQLLFGCSLAESGLPCLTLPAPGPSLPWGPSGLAFEPLNSNIVAGLVDASDSSAGRGRWRFGTVLPVNYAGKRHFHQRFAHLVWKPAVEALTILFADPLNIFLRCQTQVLGVSPERLCAPACRKPTATDWHEHLETEASLRRNDHHLATCPSNRKMRCAEEGFACNFAWACMQRLPQSALSPQPSCSVF